MFVLKLFSLFALMCGCCSRSRQVAACDYADAFIVSTDRHAKPSVATDDAPTLHLGRVDGVPDPDGRLHTIEAKAAQWRPDAALVAGIHEAVDLAVRRAAAAMLSNRVIAAMFRHRASELDPLEPTPRRHDDAARAVARHAAAIGMSVEQIPTLLGRLAAMLPGGVTDPVEAAAIARVAYREYNP